MTISKHLGIALVLSLSALSMAQDKIKIEPKWDKDTKIKLKHKFEIEIDTHHAEINGQTTWSGAMGDDGYTLTVHHDKLSIMADDNEVSPPYDDYKVGFNKKSGVVSCEGGIEGAEPVRMFLVGHFFTPTTELTKDTAVKWELPASAKTELGELKIETTYLGSVDVGKVKGYKFKQVVKESKGDFATDGTYTVTADGHVLKAEVKFQGMPIPQAGGDAKGKFTLSTVE